jgi:hypothetical protein
MRTRRLCIVLSAVALAACASGGGTAAKPTPSSSPTPTLAPYTVAATSKPCPVLGLSKIAPLLGTSELGGPIGNLGGLGSSNTAAHSCRIVTLPAQINLVLMTAFATKSGKDVFKGIPTGSPVMLPGFPPGTTFERVKDGRRTLYFVDSRHYMFIENFLDFPADGIDPMSIALLKALRTANP